jgi:hypothetical protein
LRSYKISIETFYDLIRRKIHAGDNFASPGGAKTKNGSFDVEFKSIGEMALTKQPY